MTDQESVEPPQVLPEHAEAASRILSLKALIADGGVGLDAKIRAGWQARGNSDPENMVHYLQAFCMHLSTLDHGLACALQAIFDDHGIDSGVPTMTARYFGLGSVIEGLEDAMNAGHLMVVLRYLSIVRRLRSSTPSNHRNLALTARGRIVTEPLPLPDPGAWDRAFSKAFRVRQS